MSDAVLNLSRIELMITHDGTLRVRLRNIPMPLPKHDEVIIKVEASPVNPSDLSMMLGPVCSDSLHVDIEDGRPTLSSAIPKDRLGMISGRLNLAMAVGNEALGQSWPPGVPSRTS